MEVTTPSQRAWPLWRWTLLCLNVLALALSAYLAWHYLSGGSVIGCGGGSSCDMVLSSRWSAIGGVLPVSGLAAGAYLALLVASFFIGPRTATPERRLAWGAMLILVGAAAGSAVWFFIVQEWIIGSLCPYCMATHVTGMVLAALVVWQAPRQYTVASLDVAAATSAPLADGPASASKRVMGALPAISLAVVGLALAGILAGSQVIFAPKAVYHAGESQQKNQPEFEPRAVPLVGSSSAPTLITLLFDYKCPHCQKMHAMLEETIQRYDGKVAFVLCPAPLNTQCNPYIARQVDEFKDSCDLAKIGLAMWVADHAAFHDFDTWMFAPPEGEDHLWHPHTLEAARAKAVELVGQAKFDAAMADPWIDRYMQASVRVYGNTIAPDQSGNAVPKLVLGSRWVTPEPDSVDDFVTILHASLGVPRP